MKKLVLASAAALGFVSAANAHAVDTVNKSGFYLGLNGGYSVVKDKLQFTSTYAAPVGTNTISKTLFPVGASGGAHLGYQHDFGRMVAGIEASAAYSNAKRSHKYIAAKNTNDLTVKIRRKSIYGAAIRLGYKVAPCWVAGIRIGYERNNQEIKYTLSDTGAGRAGAQLATGKRKLKYNGFAPGIYVEKLLNRHWMIGAEYSYAIYKQKSVPFTTAVAAPAGGTGYKITSKPRAHDIKIRLGYKF